LFSRVPHGPRFAFVLSLLACCPLVAQVANSPAAPIKTEAEEVVQLEPFTTVSDPIGYQVSTSTTGTRLNTALKDVPQSLSIITKDFLEDTYSTSLEDAVTFVPNVQPRQNLVDGLLIRGIQTTRKYYNNYLIPGFVAGIANVSRIEVMKGPASAIYGRGELGGVINYVPLRPSSRAAGNARVTAGAYDRIETKVDLTGPVPVVKGLNYRVTGNYLEAGDVIKFAETRQYSVNPSLTYRLGRNTELSYDGVFFHGRTPAHEGTPFLTSKFAGAPASMPEVFAPRSLNTSGAAGNGWDQRDEDVRLHFFTVTHSFRDLLYFRQGVVRYDRLQEQRKMQIANLMTRTAAGDVILSRSANHTIQEEEGLVAQGDIALKLKLFQSQRWLASAHETLIGYEYLEADVENQRWPATIGPLSVFTPNYDQVVTERATRDQHGASSRETYGYFAHHVSKFLRDRLQLSVSWRWDDEKTQAHNQLTNGRSQTAPKSTEAPRYGVAIRPIPAVTIYGLHSEQSDPEVTTRTWSGIAGTHPNFEDRFQSQVVGEIDEIGFKTELFQSRLSLTFAWFEMIRDGLIRPQNLTPEEYAMLGIPRGAAGFARNVLVMGEKSRGWEFEWFGQVTSRLSLFGGYGRLETDAETNGVRGPTRGVPSYKLTTFAKYDFRGTRQNGFDARLGVALLGPQYANTSTNLGGKHEASTRIDAGATYRHNNFDFSMQVKNVTDEIQVISAVAPGSNRLASPREFLFSVATRW
jgi:iron complex outermembrane receptor protein